MAKPVRRVINHVLARSLDARASRCSDVITVGPDAHDPVVVDRYLESAQGLADTAKCVSGFHISSPIFVASAVFTARAIGEKNLRIVKKVFTCFLREESLNEAD